MRPAPIAARRLSLFGCLTALAAASALSACGGSGGSDAAKATAAQPAKNGAAYITGTPIDPCQKQVGGFLKAMTKLRGNLEVGLSYEQYAAEIHGVRTAYAAIPVKRLTIACLAGAGTPGEKALDQYIDAANSWGECLAEASCKTVAIEPELQQKWRVASHFLAAAKVPAS
jgi:hypothetical protein